ncbi:NAD(P)-dependent oxidoreductase [Megasphaera sp. ASD88]|uniref:NAD(P)-dependent oxidoreductase n=1 Tax=Megasphaera sp. ASD88 TaxID=2027407 RepID=UPI001E3D1EA4|nr:NAD(P)-dependent oxidoreductase [Megasphaera sp. ASD88]
MMEQGDCNFATEQTIGIIGLGLIGGSYAKGLRRLGAAKILAVDVDEKALQAALADGVIDEGHRAGGEFLAQADMLIFCMAADAMMEFIRSNAAHFKAGAS